MNKSIPLFCLGPKGSYGSEVAEHCIEKLRASGVSEEYEIILLDSHVEVLERAKRENALCVVAVENCDEGIVTDVMKWRRDQTSFPQQIVGEVHFSIRHNLLVRQGTVASQVKRVISHVQALGQCRNSLASRGIRVAGTANSTAAAAEKLARGEYDDDVAVIASPYAKEIYGLDSLGEIGDVETNETTFHLCGPWGMPPTGDDCTVMFFQILDQQGVLYEPHCVLKENGINIRRLDSIRTGVRNQIMFYLDVEMHKNSKTGIRVIEQLCKVTQNLRILGSFPKAENRAVPISNLAKYRVAVIGCGMMGKSIAEFLTFRGMDVYTFDKGNEMEVSPDVIKASDVVILTVPIDQVASVMATCTHHMSGNQLLIDCSSVMAPSEKAYRGEVMFAHVHFKAAPRGQSFSGRRALVNYHNSVTAEMRRWCECFITEFDALPVLLSVEAHDMLCQAGQANVVLAMYLFGEMLMRFCPNPGEFICSASPVEETMLGMLAKILNQGSMYGNMVSYNPNMLVAFEHLSDVVYQMGYDVLSQKIPMATLIQKLRERLGTSEDVARLAERFEQRLR